MEVGEVLFEELEKSISSRNKNRWNIWLQAANMSGIFAIK